MNNDFGNNPIQPDYQAPAQPEMPVQPEVQYQVPQYQAPQYQAPVQQPQYQAPAQQAPSYQAPVYQQPVQQGYQPAYPTYQPVEQPANGLATASLVLGIISLILCWLYGAGLVTGIVGIVTGAMAKKRGNQSGSATGGLVMSIIAVAISAIWVIGCIACAGAAGCTACSSDYYYYTAILGLF